MSEMEDNFVLDDKRLGFIDILLEDDCLYSSPSRDSPILPFSDLKFKQRDTLLLDVVDINNTEDSTEDEEQPPQPLKSLKSKGTIKNARYNPRKSLAWDSAFFTSAGVLEPEELSIMMGEAEGCHHSILPVIPEDAQAHQSTGSLAATLASDSLALDALEADLFGDIRASIKKSNEASSVEISNNEMGSGFETCLIVHSSDNVKICSQNKMKMKATSKMPNLIFEGSRKMANHVFPSSKHGVVSEKPSSTICNTPRVGGNILSRASSRFSLGATRAKVESDNTKQLPAHSLTPKHSTVANKGAKIAVSGPTRNMKPTARAKAEQAADPHDTSPSRSSESSSRSSLHCTKNNGEKREASRTGAHSSSVSTIRAAMRIIQRKKTGSSCSHKSATSSNSTVKQLPSTSSLSPTSSTSEWSLEPPSPISTLDKRSSASKSSPVSDPSKDTRCAKSDDVTGPTIPLLCPTPDSIKPSGLRMPSPKIGFFDAGMPKGGKDGVISYGGGKNGAKLVKCETARAVGANRSMKPAVAQQPVTLEQSNVVLKANSRKERQFVASSRMQKGAATCESGRESNLKNGKSSRSSVKNGNVIPLPVKNAKVTPSNNGANAASCNSNCIGKEEDEVDNLAKQMGSMDVRNEDIGADHT